MDEYKQNMPKAVPLPACAYFPLNRCNLPAQILGGLGFQEHPVPLHLDGVEEFHTKLFAELEKIRDKRKRAENFQDYMKSGFLLDNPDEAGFTAKYTGRSRDKANYLSLLRGWMFDANGQEAAVLKAWVESRFGLRTRSHGPLDAFGTLNQAYLKARTQGLYNTNALEAQLDLLYTYCQYEVRRCLPSQKHIKLYRGFNGIEEHEILAHTNRRNYILLLNNLNSFTHNRDRASEFGDYIVEINAPLVKLLYMPELLPGVLKGEGEYLVIGGVYSLCLTE